MKPKVTLEKLNDKEVLVTTECLGKDLFEADRILNRLLTKYRLDQQKLREKKIPFKEDYPFDDSDENSSKTNF